MDDPRSEGAVSLWTVLQGHSWRVRARVVARLLRGQRELVVLEGLTDEQMAADKARHAEDQRFGNVVAPARGTPYTCPCCGHATLSERGAYGWCRECDWEDDGQDDHDSHIVRRAGPNGISLDEARARYVASGRSRGAHVAPAPPRGGIE